MREINYEKFKAAVTAGDYFLDSTIHGMDYYVGNDELNFIVAVDETKKRGVITDFLEMDDFPDQVIEGKTYRSDYAIRYDEKADKYVCFFEHPDYNLEMETHK